MPRMLAETPGPKAPWVRRNSAFGTTAVRSATESSPRSFRPSAVIAVMAIGVSCMFVAWRVAVTTISAIPPSPALGSPSATSCADAVAVQTAQTTETDASRTFFIVLFSLDCFRRHRHSGVAGSLLLSDQKGVVAARPVSDGRVVEAGFDAEAERPESRSRVHRFPRHRSATRCSPPYFLRRPTGGVLWLGSCRRKADFRAFRGAKDFAMQKARMDRGPSFTVISMRRLVHSGRRKAP